MGDTIVLGRVLGIRVGINWSWLLIAALLVWTLAGTVFPSTNAGLSTTAYVAMATVATLLFFTCIVLHELGHAVQAQRERVEIVGITLWMLGGVAKMAGPVQRAGTELRIALAGPAVSLVLGLAFAGAAAALSLPEPVDAVCAWLGYVNLVLLVFNLVPAFPLDGGRVLLASLWLRSGDEARAARQALIVSRLAAASMIVLGVGLALTGDVASGIWLGLIGWFLLQAAAREAGQRTTEALLAGIRVGDLMSRDLVVVQPQTTLLDVVDGVVWTSRFTTYPVVDGDRPIGLLPFAALASVPRADWASVRVVEVMLPIERVVVLDPSLSAKDAIVAVSGTEARRALVVDGGRLVGILSIADLSRALEVGGPSTGA